MESSDLLMAFSLRTFPRRARHQILWLVYISACQDQEAYNATEEELLQHLQEICRQIYLLSCHQNLGKVDCFLMTSSSSKTLSFEGQPLASSVGLLEISILALLEMVYL